MPNLEILTSDGKTASTPLPAGIDPSTLTPEIVEQIAKDAGIRNFQRITPITPQATDTGATDTVDRSKESFLSRAASSVGRAVNDRITDPLSTMFNSDLNSQGNLKVGMFDRLMAEGQILGAAVSPGLTAAGAGAQALAETGGLSPDAARLIGGVTEIGGGIMNMVGAVRGIGKTVRGLAGEAKAGLAAITPPGMSRSEAAGKFVKDAVTSKFRQLGADFGAKFNNTEQAIRKATPNITPGSPGYGELNNLLNYSDDAAASAGPKADALMARIKGAVYHTDPSGVPAPQDVAMDDVIKLRKILHERAGVSKAMDPDASVVGKKAAEMRDRAMDVIRSASPDDLARGYDELRASARVQLYEPERFLITLTAQKTTPLRAFKAVFSNSDPNALRVTGELIGSDPKLATKLKFGVVEALQDALQNPAAATKALKRLEVFEPTIHQLGIFKPDEMEAMKFMMKSAQTPTLIRELTSMARTNQVLMRGMLGAGAATAVSSSPLALAIGAVAFGGLPQLRRASMLPAGSKAQKKLLGVVVRNAAKGFQSMFGG